VWAWGVQEWCQCLASSAIPARPDCGWLLQRPPPPLVSADGSHLVATLLGHQGSVHPGTPNPPCCAALGRESGWAQHVGVFAVSGAVLSRVPQSISANNQCKQTVQAISAASVIALRACFPWQVSFSPDGNFLYSGARKVSRNAPPNACCTASEHTPGPNQPSDEAAWV